MARRCLVHDNQLLLAWSHGWKSPCTENQFLVPWSHGQKRPCTQKPVFSTVVLWAEAHFLHVSNLSNFQLSNIIVLCVSCEVFNSLKIAHFSFYLIEVPKQFCLFRGPMSSHVKYLRGFIGVWSAGSKTEPSPFQTCIIYNRTCISRPCRQ